MFGLFKELAEILTEGGQELGEICTDGFREMVIKGNSNYETSFEKRDRANQIVASAKSRYKSAAEDFKSYYEKTNRLLNEHYHYKKTFSERFLSQNIRFVEEVKPRIKDMYNLNSGISAGALAGLSATTIATSSALSSFTLGSFVKLNPALFGLSLAFGLVSQSLRVEEANEYLEEAKDFKEEVNYEINKLEIAKENLRFIRKVIKEEQYLLSLLTQELSEYITAIKRLMERPKLDSNEIAIINNYIKMSQIINSIITTKFLNNKGAVTSEYQNLLEQLRQIYRRFKEEI